MNVLSDSDSSDSDTGRRFKTESTRAKEEFQVRKKPSDRRSDSKAVEYNRKRHDKDRYSPKHRRSKSPAYHRDNHRRKHHSRSRSRSREHNTTRKRQSKDRSRSRSRGKDVRNRNRDDKYSKQREERKQNTSSSSREKEKSSHHSSGSSKKSEKQQKRDTTPHKKSHSKPDDVVKKGEHKEIKSDTPNDNNKTEKYKKHKRDKEKSKCQYGGDMHANKSGSDHSSHENNKREEHRSKSIEKRTVIIESNERNGNHNNIDETQVTENLLCGPSLPPHMLQSNSKIDDNLVDKKLQSSPKHKKLFGPTLPSEFQSSSYRSPSIESNEQQSRPDSAIVDISASEDEDFFGPVPIDHEKTSEAHLELEKRALELKLAKLNEKERNLNNSMREREEWMTELPELRSVAGLGLTARQFRTKERDEIKDRSTWTDTPHEREEKSRKKCSSHDDLVRVQSKKTEKMFRDKRDAEQESAAKKHKKKHKRDESLLELHQKKLKKKSHKETAEKTERRPFSRDSDLQVNRFDEAQKKSIIKKAQLLDTRFSSGQSKFL